MADQTSIENIKEQLSNLSEREKKMLLAMGIIMPLLAMILAIGIFQNEISEIKEQTSEYQQSLELLSLTAPDYIEEKKSKESEGGLAAKFTEEALEDNEIKLTSFVATHAAATDINVSSYDEDELPLGSKNKDSGPIIVEKQLRVEIRDAPLDKLVKMLERIETSDKPVVIKRIDLRRKRRKEGSVRALLVVSTFIKKKQKS